MKSQGVIVCIAAAMTFSVAATAKESAEFATALTSGEVGTSLRYRYEHLDQDNFIEDANAATARLRLNYRTGLWNGWSAFGEFDHVFHVLLRDFNSGAGTSPGRSQYPVVADPSGADLNQLYVDYRSSHDWTVRLGRQQILLDNHRFVGNVGWRQNVQTYDGLTLTTDALSHTEFSYTYVNYVRRIFGDTVPAGKDKVNTHLLNAKVTINERWAAIPYFYYLDYDDPARAANSTATAGVRFVGTVPVGSSKLALVGEFATQSDAANNPVNYDAQYQHVDALWSMTTGLSLGLGFESLGGDTMPGRSFRTPLATLHRFQGWADRFLATPTTGMDDFYATIKYKISGWDFTAVYHDFSAESGGDGYGNEWDASIGRGFAEHFGVLFKAAIFSGDSAAYPDANIVWIQLTANY